MKTTTKNTLLATSLAVFALGSGAALAYGGMGGMGGMGGCDDERGMRDGKPRLSAEERSERMEERAERKAARMNERFDALAEKLALRPEQQAAWQQFRTATQERQQSAMKGMKGMKGMQDGSQTLSAPERLAQMETYLQERLAMMAEMRTVLETFYAQLDEAQRKTFDENLPQAGRGAYPSK